MIASINVSEFSQIGKLVNAEIKFLLIFCMNSVEFAQISDEFA